VSAADDIRENVLHHFCSMLDVTELADGGFAITTPFEFGDGDGYPVVLERVETGWRFTDKGNATSHLFFDDLELSEARLKFIHRAVDVDGVSMSDRYVLNSEVYEDLPSASDLADFVQAIARVGGAVALEKQPAEKYLSTLRTRVINWVPRATAIPNWSDRRRDPQKLYPADLRVGPELKRPVVMFFVAGALKAANTSTSILNYRQWDLSVTPLVTYKPGTPSKTVDRLQDALRGYGEAVPADAGNQGARTVRRVLREHNVALVDP
jgi:hypothetical protein